jgi:pyruvate ferredoxin oxidoreductase beta subunit
VSRLKRLVRNENGTPPLRGGHSLCQGCGIPMVVRTIVDTIDTPVVVVSATGCLEVATTRFPSTAWNVPWLHVAFENAAAVASGVETAYRALGKRGALPQEGPITFVVLAGDGGTYDIGLQSLSGALERGHRFLFVCYDNEAYMNTGVQRSGATPFGASTTTTPAGRVALGKVQQRKDMTAIAVAHHVPYVAQAASSHWHDLSRKVERASHSDGPAFINVLTDCPVGWGHEPRDSHRIVDAAVNSCFWPLYEVVDGRYRLTYVPETVVPVEEWLRGQARFAHLLRPESRGSPAEIQASVDAEWTDLCLRCGVDERRTSCPRELQLTASAE